MLKRLTDKTDNIEKTFKFRRTKVMKTQILKPITTLIFLSIITVNLWAAQATVNQPDENEKTECTENLSVFERLFSWFNSGFEVADVSEQPVLVESWMLDSFYWSGSTVADTENPMPVEAWMSTPAYWRQATEQPLTYEAWMFMGNHWNRNIAWQLPAKAVESALSYEGWMSNSAHWYVLQPATETGLQIENWMIQPAYWQPVMVPAAEEELQYEDWMTDKAHWNLPSVK